MGLGPRDTLSPSTLPWVLGEEAESLGHLPAGGARSP